MRIKSSLTILVAGMLAASVVLSGCTGTSGGPPSTSASPGPVPTTAPSVTPTPTQTVTPCTDNEWGVDVCKVIIPADVAAAYGTDGTKNLVTDALTSASIAYNEMADLHEARTGDEALYYEPMRDRMTPEMYDSLVKDALSTDSTARNNSDALVPTAERDGSLITLNGVTYKADPANPFSWVMVDLPRISLETGATAKDQRVIVDMTLALTAPCLDGSILTLTRVLRLNLTYSADGHWLVSGWQTTVTVPFAVRSAS